MAIRLILGVIDFAANMIGRSNIRRAVRRSFGIIQVKILNLHLILNIIDEVCNGGPAIMGRTDSFGVSR